MDWLSIHLATGCVLLLMICNFHATNNQQAIASTHGLASDEIFSAPRDLIDGLFVLRPTCLKHFNDSWHLITDEYYRSAHSVVFPTIVFLSLNQYQQSSRHSFLWAHWLKLSPLLLKFGCLSSKTS